MPERIDRRDNLAYNSLMIKTTPTTTKTWLWVLRAALILSSMATIIFIFSNSLKPAEQSAQQSSNVLQVVQKIATIVAPNSQIANATGPLYDWLHILLRSIAHFLEFFLLGALCSGVCSTYTFAKIWQACPIGTTATVAVVDECLQLTATARAFQFTDILLDVCGGVAGVGFTIFCVWIGLCIYRRSKAKNKAAGTKAKQAFVNQAEKE